MYSHTNNRVRPWSNRPIHVGDEKMRVLVVDDHPLAAEALAIVLSLENMASRTAFGGFQAIAVAFEWYPHVIIMDISMPDCTGYEAALVLRLDARSSLTTIIAFTALDETEIRRNAVFGVFDGYCQKGQEPAKLITLITRCITKPEDSDLPG